MVRGDRAEKTDGCNGVRQLTDEQLFCYGCARRHPAGTQGEMIKDSKGNSRWCCGKCVSAKRDAARLKNSPHRFAGKTAKSD